MAAGSAATSTARPPIHAPAASTCSALAGSSTATGSCTPAWPPSPGSSASAATGTASAQVHGPGPGSALPAAPTVAGRSAGTACGRIAANRPISAHAIAPSPQTTPKRVSSTSRTPPSADHSEVPSAVAACSASAATAASPPAAADTSSSARPRAAKAAAAPAQRGSAPAVARSPGSQTRISTASTPSASAIAPYSTARATPNATDVTGPAFWSPSRSATLADGAAASSPTLNTKPPLTGCESAETTR